MFDWVKLLTAKGDIKLHESWDYNLIIPDMVNITDAKVHDRYGLKQLILPKDSVIVEYRAYFNFELLQNRIKAGNIFVTRIKSNILCQSIEELVLPDYIEQGILKDEII
jgi:hypothetical protein